MEIPIEAYRYTLRTPHRQHLGHVITIIRYQSERAALRAQVLHFPLSSKVGNVRRKGVGRTKPTSLPAQPYNNAAHRPGAAAAIQRHHVSLLIQAPTRSSTELLQTGVQLLRVHWDESRHRHPPPSFPSVAGTGRPMQVELRMAADETQTISGKRKRSNGTFAE